MTTSFPLVTLQPVADARQAWVALMLETATPVSGDDLVRLFGEFGLGEALGPLPCIISLGDTAIDLSALPAGQIILRLPTALLCDPSRFAELAAWQTAGFRLMGEGMPPPQQSLYAGVTTLALQCAGDATPRAVTELLDKLPGPHLALSATLATCPGQCRFKWFAGDHAGTAQPAADKSKDATNNALLLDLLAKVTSDAEAAEIEAVIKRDPQLSYKLLKLVNSVAFSTTTKIKSFSQAITLLGRRQLQRWLQLLLYAGSGKDAQASPLLSRAALRAGLMETLCRQAGGARDSQDRAFMTGMFSLLDQLLGVPVVEIVKPLNLAEDVVDALGAHRGGFGELLLAIEASEAAPGAKLEQSLAVAGIDHENWARALTQASQWAIQISREA